MADLVGHQTRRGRPGQNPATEPAAVARQQWTHGGPNGRDLRRLKPADGPCDIPLEDADGRGTAHCATGQTWTCLAGGVFWASACTAGGGGSARAAHSRERLSLTTT